MRIMTTANDLRNWIDDATSNWHNRTDADMQRILDAIRADNCPAWGDDWQDYLETLDLDGLAEEVAFEPAVPTPDDWPL